MATYPKWNRALAEYFTSGLPAGSTIYLSVDDDVLESIGQSLGTRIGTSWTDDFLEAVRQTCVASGVGMSLEGVGGYSDGDVPDCIGFLGAMVFAAHRMIGEEDELIGENNYFKRFRQVFGLTEEQPGRPDGLKPAGVEEQYWRRWNRWLASKGFVPSAERGKGGPATRYTHYPLSQALLRQGDKERIERLFFIAERAGTLGRIMDGDGIGLWFRNHSFNSRHLTELASEPDPRRFNAAVDALLELHGSMDWSQDPETGRSSTRTFAQRQLVGSLYRYECPITGNIEYRLYPPMPKRSAASSLEIFKDGRWYVLRAQRPGWFMPLWEESPAGDCRYELRGDDRLSHLVVPSRGFWTLVRDADDPSSTIFANWRPPGIEETFLVLCRAEYAAQMQRLRQDNLLQWSGDPFELMGSNHGWLEFRECMVISREWDDLIPQNADLVEALRPRIGASICLSGGLRVPNRWAWIEGYGPEIKIFAFADHAVLKVLDLSNSESLVFEDEVVTGEPLVPVLSLPQGDYLVEAFTQGPLAARQSFRIVSWKTADATQPPETLFYTDLPSHRLCGAVLSECGDNE